MKSLKLTGINIKRLLSDKEWLIERETYNKEEHSFYETLFTLSNGYIGLRNTIEFDSQHNFPGCYFINLYDMGIAVKSTISNAPNFLDIKVIIDDIPINFDEVNILSFYQALDLKNSFVYTFLRFEDMFHRITQIEYITLIHGKLYHAGIILGNIKPENYSGVVFLKFSTNYGIGNAYLWDLSPFVRICHWTSPTTEYVDGLYCGFKSVFKNQAIGYASKIVTTDSSLRFINSERFKICENIRIDINKGKAYGFIKYVTFFTSNDSEDITKDSKLLLNTLLTLDINTVLKEHFTVWDKKWDVCNILIRGDNVAQKSIRFALYHLLQIYDKNWGQNIPARGLTSEYHSGHYFFNTELFVFFFYLYNFPDKAKALLKFRYKTLDAARGFAKNTGYKGARYPEEADNLGRPDSPSNVKNFLTGREFESLSGNEVYHMSADISYAIQKYFEYSFDYEFMLTCGLEMLIEIARFYSSLVEWNKKRRKYIIESVMGPDESHYHVNNNYFTNYMAKWAISYCLQVVDNLRNYDLKKTEKIKKKTALTDNEIKRWRYIIERIYFPFQNKNGIIEQFDGYFSLPDYIIKKYDVKGRPLLPVKYRETLKYLNSVEARIIKQADVVLLFYLFRDSFDSKTKKVNFNFYERRTLHESSLSGPCYGLVAADIGEIDKAYEYFIKALRYNLDFTPRNNYLNGLHYGAYGGAYRILVEAFAGIKVLRKNEIKICPKIPKNWKRLILRIKLFGVPIKLDISHTTIALSPLKKRKFVPFVIQINEKEISIAHNKNLVIPYQGNYVRGV